MVAKRWPPGRGAGDRVGTLAWNATGPVAVLGVSGSGAVRTPSTPDSSRTTGLHLNHARTGAVLRHHLRPAGSKACPATEDGAHLQRDTIVRTCPSSGRRDAVLRELIDAQSSVMMAGFDGAGVVAVLHLGHHRNPKGCCLAPLDGAACLGAIPRDGFDIHAGSGSWWWSDVHANAWGHPYTAPMVGAKWCWPGRPGRCVPYTLMRDERVNFTLGVRRSGDAVLYLDEHPNRSHELKRSSRAPVGRRCRSPCGTLFFERDFGSEVVRAGDDRDQPAVCLRQAATPARRAVTRAADPTETQAGHGSGV